MYRERDGGREGVCMMHRQQLLIEEGGEVNVRDAKGDVAHVQPSCLACDLVRCLCIPLGVSPCVSEDLAKRRRA